MLLKFFNFVKSKINEILFFFIFFLLLLLSFAIGYLTAKYQCKEEILINQKDDV